MNYICVQPRRVDLRDWLTSSTIDEFGWQHDQLAVANHLFLDEVPERCVIVFGITRISSNTV